MSIDGDEQPPLGIRTKADEALFAAGVWIRDHQRVRVFERQRCVSEVDLMFPEVRSRLGAVPFVPGHGRKRMYKCALASRMNCPFQPLVRRLAQAIREHSFSTRRSKNGGHPSYYS